MKFVVHQQSFSEWLKTVSPPPVKVSEAKLKELDADRRAELDAANNRTIIDPCKINVFTDPDREGLA